MEGWHERGKSFMVDYKAEDVWNEDERRHYNAKVHAQCDWCPNLLIHKTNQRTNSSYYWYDM